MFDQTSRTLPSHLGSAAGASVLLIGHSANMAQARAVLIEAGCQTRLEQDGLAALAALDAAPYDLAVVDVELPGDGGAAFCRAVRARPRHADLYIIALTATPGPAPIPLLEAGADDYVSAPLDEVQLLVRARAGVRNAQLHTSEARLRTLVANVPGAIYRCANDADWTMELISEDIERICGYPPADFVNSAVRSFASIIHPDDREQVAHDVAEATRQGRQFVLEYRIVRADGSIAEVLERGQQVDDSTGRRWLDGVIFDITERRRAEHALHESQRRLAVVEDRERIARELHDGVVQALFGLGMQLQAASKVADRPDEIRACLAGGVDCLDAVIEDVRNYVFGLRPTLLAGRELSGALEQLAGSFQDGSQILTVLDIDADVAVRLTPLGTDILQLAREALSNVQRHAHATTCRISLERAGDAALLKIDDDGRGFVPAAGVADGQGLRNLAERSERLGGRLEVRSGGTGTTLTIHLPLDGR